MRMLLLCPLLFPCFTWCQQIIDVDKVSSVREGSFFNSTGFAFSPNKYIRVVSGSPYFNDNWMKGDALTTSNIHATSNFVKLDLLSDELIYKDSLGNELIAITPVRQLVLTDSVAGKKYVFVNAAYLDLPGKSASGWYEILESGTVSLYQKHKKSISEARLFTSATVEQTIHTSYQYYVVLNNTIKPVKKLSDILTAIEDKENQLEEYIRTNKFKGKKEADFRAVVTHYNALATGQ